MFDREDAVRVCRSIMEKGSEEDALRWLRQSGASPIDSIRTLTQLGVPLSDAKRSLHFSETWADIRESSEEFHANAVQAGLELQEETRSKK